jgi:hypothetical protein
MNRRASNPTQRVTPNPASRITVTVCGVDLSASSTPWRRSPRFSAFRSGRFSEWSRAILLAETHSF